MTADEILTIPLSDPGRLFSRDQVKRKSQYHDLARRWHPDAGGTSEVFAHIGALVAQADAGMWGGGKVERFTDLTGKTFELKFMADHAFELGRVFIGHKMLAWLLKPEHDGLLMRGLAAIGGVRFSELKLTTQYLQFAPAVGKVVSVNGGTFVVMRKSLDVGNLADIVAFAGGALPPKHVAWIVSRLLELCCLYEIAGITHNGMTPASVFVSPAKHSAFPLGGWWYSVKHRGELKHLPPEVYAVAPTDAVVSKIADPRIDLMSVRAIARYCLGDPSGSRLTTMADVPKPFADWLRLPSERTPVRDYAGWERVLAKAWGKRAFVKLEIDPEKIYG